VIQIFGTAKCKVTRAAQRFFADRGVRVQFVDVREKAPSKGELASVARAVGGMRALYAHDGARAKERGLMHAGPSDERIAELLEGDALLLVTPIVRAIFRDGTRATVGEAEATWRTFAATAKAEGDG
jgi:arsenate reductase